MDHLYSTNGLAVILDKLHLDGYIQSYVKAELTSIEVNVIKQWLQMGKIIKQKISRSDNQPVQRINCQLDVDQFGQPIFGDSLRAEQHRIYMVHIQNRKLQMNIEIWNKCSISAIYEVQELLSDQTISHR